METRIHSIPGAFSLEEIENSFDISGAVRNTWYRVVVMKGAMNLILSIVLLTALLFGQEALKGSVKERGNR